MYAKSCAQHMDEFDRNDRIPAFKDFGEENAHAAKQQMTRMLF